MKTIAYPQAVPPEWFDLAVLICPNGAGHHKRVFGALDLILKAKPELKVVVFADQKATERFMKDFEPLQRVAESNTYFVFGVVNPGLDIMAKDPLAYANGQWFTWLDRLAPYRNIIWNAKAVWADALPQALMLRPDAIFSSSFTFGPIILERWGKREDALGYASNLYAQQEERLMKMYLPKYVCPKMFAMDFMYERARVKEVGVMKDFEPLPRNVESPVLVALNGGLTGLAGEIIKEAGKYIEAQSSGQYRLAVDKNLAEAFPNAHVMKHDAETYASLFAMIMRPGVSGSTNCITAGVPIIAISEPDLEMENNGKRIQQYDLGIQVRSSREALEALGEIADPDWQQKYEFARQEISLSGLQELADEILAKI